LGLRTCQCVCIKLFWSCGRQILCMMICPVKWNYNFIHSDCWYSCLIRKWHVRIYGMSCFSLWTCEKHCIWKKKYFSYWHVILLQQCWLENVWCIIVLHASLGCQLLCHSWLGVILAKCVKMQVSVHCACCAIILLMWYIECSNTSAFMSNFAVPWLTTL
jgi:hypothetical protein